MSLPLSNQLFTATYNGVPFFIDTSKMDYGRKTVTHEYPNKQYRYIEDLGANLRTFSITGLISGDNYLLQREALIVALQIPGIGVFTHPFYGLVFVVVTSYSVSEDIKTLGECVFNITFQESRPNIYPIAGNETIATIANLANDVLAFLAAGAVTQFALLFKRNIPDSATKCQQLNSDLHPAQPLTTDQEALNNFNSNSVNFNKNIYSLLQTPQNLFSSLNTLMNSYNDLGATASDSYELNANVFYFGDDDIDFKITTPELNERFNNRTTINCYINALLLINLYQDATEINFLDDVQLFQVVNDLETKYQYLILNNNFDRNTLLHLETLRTAIRRFFALVQVNVNKITTITSPGLPLSSLMYMYNNDYSLENEIISLNNIFDATNIQGEVKVLTP